MASAETDIVRGRVVAVSKDGGGIRVGESWFNYSQFGPDIARAQRGDEVELSVSGGRWITALRLLGRKEPEAPKQQASGARGSSYRPMTPERERTITRLSLISSAATLFANRPDYTEMEVLKAAIVWEAWAAGAAELADIRNKVRTLLEPRTAAARKAERVVRVVAHESESEGEDKGEPEPDPFALPSGARTCSVCGALVHPAAAFQVADGEWRCPRHRESATG